MTRHEFSIIMNLEQEHSFLGVFQMSPLAKGGVEGSARLLMTKIETYFFNSPLRFRARIALGSRPPPRGVIGCFKNLGNIFLRIHRIHPVVRRGPYLHRLSYYLHYHQLLQERG